MTCRGGGGMIVMVCRVSEVGGYGGVFACTWQHSWLTQGTVGTSHSAPCVTCVYSRGTKIKVGCLHYVATLRVQYRGLLYAHTVCSLCHACTNAALK